MARDIEKLNEEKLPISGEILKRARKVLLSPQVTGPFRAPSSVAFVKEARGSKIIDYDGNEYVDVTMAYGPLILGHSHPVVVEAAEKAIRNGTVYAIAHETEVRWAEIMVDSIPCAERVAFVNSGTEATMHAIKMARARSGKDRIAKFEGGYHGVHECAQVSSIMAPQMGPVEDPESVPDTPGIPQAFVDQVLTLSYLQPESLDKIKKHSDELAAVIIEPVPSSFPVDMGDYLRELRRVTSECGVLLIFDEVISGFRLRYGGAQEYFGITPDIATYGKIMGGGFPAGAIAGSVDALQPIITSGNPLQDFQEKLLIVGTFSGNPVTASAGIATLEYLREHPEIYSPHRRARRADQAGGARLLPGRGLQVPLDRARILVPALLRGRGTEQCPRPGRSREPGERRDPRQLHALPRRVSAGPAHGLHVVRAQRRRRRQDHRGLRDLAHRDEGGRSAVD